MSFEKNLSVPFGKATKNVLYYLDPNMRFTNHGSYGTAPKLILERKREYQAEMERCPDRWFRFTSFGKWNESLQALSDYLKVDKANLLLFENATEAINTVLKWVEVDGGSKDAVLTTAINYQAILNAIDYTAKYRLKPENHVNVVKMNIKFPIPSVDDFVKQFDDTCRDIVENKKLRLRVAVIDHIASSTAIMYPIEAITKVIRKWAGSKCIIIIDGAHSLGQTKLDFSPEKFHADFYVSNLHKWFLAPRSCAFLYTSKKGNYDQNFQPCYISHGYVNQTVSYNHFQRGTTDKTSLYVVPECINFYENYLGGLDHIRQYTDPLLNRAVEMLEREWGTKRLQVPTDMLAPFMRVVKLPELPEYRLEKGRTERDLCNKATVGLIKHLMDKYNVVAFIGIINDELYCRITCFVYQEMDDYIALKDAILKIKNGG